MIAAEPNRTDRPGTAGAPPDRGARQERNDQPVGTLRGATVDVDIRRAGQVVVGVGVAALFVTGIVLLIAGVQNNSQINSLRHDGRPVTVTVSGCLGLMGGTGAQVAGYSCTGTYTVDGTRYRQSIPGPAFRAPGSSFQGVVVPSDPKLLSTPDQLARQHTSWRVFILPAVLLVAAVAAGSVLLLRRRGPSTPDGAGAVGAR